MDSEEKNVRRSELKDEALEEIAGGSGPFLCRCPRCYMPSDKPEGTLCPNCKWVGIDSPVVKV